ncbi:MAG: polysaccharide biosynthesis tyrosine autokinase [Desulfobaccales bacterium]|nr:polysaccharide biosynthesis tyrosine autokinase [Desulfobaccales bacterium]
MDKDNQFLGPLITQAHIPPPASDYRDLEQEPEFHLRDYWHVLVKRKWWFISFFVVVVTFTWLVNKFMDPIFRATATVRVTIENKGGMLGSNDPLTNIFRDDERALETQFTIMRSRSLAKRVISAFHLQDHPDFKKSDEKSDKKEERPDPDASETGLINLFLGNLSTDRVKKTDLINVSFDSKDKFLAQRIANVLAEEYIQFEIDTKNQSFVHIKKWLEKQLAQLGNKVEGSQRKLYEYGEQGGFLSLDDKENVIIQKYIELSSLLTKAQSERIAKEAQYRQIKEKGTGAGIITNNGLLQTMRKDMAQQHAKVSSLEKIYLPDHPKLKAEKANLQALQERLNSEVQGVRTSIETDYEAARRTENLLLEATESQKRQVADLQRKLVQYKILKRDVETSEELYRGLLARMKEASVASTMVPSNVAIIDPAETPQFPFKPKKAKNMMIAMLIGLLGGVFLAFTVEYFDDSIKTAEEAERVCQLPTLGLVPWFARNPKDLAQLGQGAPGLITYKDPKSMIADAIFVVRTSVLLSAPGGPPEAIMVTSPNPLEGKTTMVTNLGIALAMDGRKVVIVDGDLRRPAVHKLFKQASHPGLSDLLTGNASYQDVLQTTEIPNLFLLPCGPVPPNPVNLLGSSAFRETIEYLRGEFDHIIVDSPPTLSIPDSRVISSVVDAVILVLKHHHTPKETAKLARQLLSQVHAGVIGTILNMVVVHKLRYSGYYYKRYHYYYSKPAAK